MKYRLLFVKTLHKLCFGCFCVMRRGDGYVNSYGMFGRRRARCLKCARERG